MAMPAGEILACSTRKDPAVMVQCQEQERIAHEEGCRYAVANVIDDSRDTVVTAYEEQYLTRAYENALRQQAAVARYPDLLVGSLARNGSPIYSCRRPASGLVSRVVRHDALLPEQQRQLAEFRFHQYVLWHWYDTKAIIANQLQSDPGFRALPSATLHAFVGNEDGQILAYFTIQPAQDRSEPKSGGVFHRLVQAYVTPHKHYLGEVERPLFPAEWESFGPMVFASLPALQQASLADIRELNCLLRNQALSFATTVVAVVETAYTISRLLVMPELHLSALLGCINQDARKVLAKLGMPMLYAPHAPVVQNNLPNYWSADMNDSGKFWPFAVGTKDLLDNPEHFARLNDILELSPSEIGHALVQYRRAGNRIHPISIQPDVSLVPYTWTENPVSSALPRLAGSPHDVVSPERDVVLSSTLPIMRPLKVTGVTHAAHSN
jgi:hypothetical protein